VPTIWNLTKTKRSSSGLTPLFNCPRFSARRSLWEALTFRYPLKPCVWVSCLTVSWPLFLTSGICLATFLWSATDKNSEPVASGWSTRSVYWSTSASIKQLYHIWLRCAFLSQPPTTNVTSALQHTVTWQFHDNQTVTIRNKKLLCVWSAAAELTTLTVCDVSLTLTQLCTFLFSRAYGTSS